MSNFGYLRSAAALFPIIALTLAAQRPPGNWDSVKAISPGSEVRVERSGAASFRGQLQSVTDDALVVTSGNGTETIARQPVGRVYVKKKGHRLRNTLIGMGAGAGAGLGIGLATTCTGECSYGHLARAVTAVIAASGALSGAIIGAVIPTGGWRLVYKQ